MLDTGYTSISFHLFLWKGLKMGNAVFWLGLFVLIIMVHGEPDMVDAITDYIRSQTECGK